MSKYLKLIIRVITSDVIKDLVFKAKAKAKAMAFKAKAKTKAQDLGPRPRPRPRPKKLKAKTKDIQKPLPEPCERHSTIKNIFND